MYIALVVICHLTLICSQQIGIEFINTLVLENSIVKWNSFNNETCFSQTTIYSSQAWMTTNPTAQNGTNSLSTLLTTIGISSTNESLSSIVYTCSDGSFGMNCNISSDICLITNPCYNNGTCYVDKSLSLGYYCQCPSGFSGSDCQYDNRLCGENTCWNNGTCIEMNTTIYTCQCIYGYEGSNCQLELNMCDNITCENHGICLSSYLTWSCQCLDSSLYSGIYCQEKSSSLVVKQALSKSFSIVAILAICTVVGFIVIMDILKYIFKIDPVDRERHRLQLEEEKNEQKKFQKKKRKKPKIKTFWLQV